MRRAAKECEDCSRPLRPRGTSAADHPGTLVAVSSTRCARCAQARRVGPPAYRKHPPIKVGQPCGECGHPMRSNTMPAADAPGTVEHFHHGTCRRCARRIERLDVRARPTKPRPAEQPAPLAGLTSDQPDTRTAAEALARYMTGRRQRATPRKAPTP